MGSRRISERVLDPGEGTLMGGLNPSSSKSTHLLRERSYPAGDGDMESGHGDYDILQTQAQTLKGSSVHLERILFFPWATLKRRVHLCPATDVPSTSTSQMRISMPHAALTADLTGTSSKSVAKISIAALVDFDLVSPQQQTYLVDKNKVSREVETKRKNLGKMI
ncbi:hypothetical protein AVEN_168394-1 [Araneus ventricosus]|uniref:Uncharacterized protein n=1 Tax=Araneus ventricosus TaxID=182803 RepID=A0A4Y2GN09_ARAVE|nr:hypothetical protein AVEN_168394-1 [Araneus ventricosus]